MDISSKPIRILPQDVIGKIAAGEVVERPAAAVKELVENAIDAGASAITVELTDGGITSIRVSDNGAGIPAEQMKMAFARHATSKLETAEELFHVQTLGFRGEALASIAAIAKVACTSKTADAEYGMKAKVEAGRFTDFREAASPVGTSITVNELFFNAPVRLKFLKKTRDRGRVGVRLSCPADVEPPGYRVSVCQPGKNHLPFNGRRQAVVSDLRRLWKGCGPGYAPGVGECRRRTD